ncbi:toxin [Campylobacter mucosalis]|uniref:toxin n=1 Tax=Campylobacter mucosalis TaxID=202 RepID=UPI0004D34126|nr:toxin [Campylobacter mucosalis]KEA45883.1 toxin [Campylobacter mucosalis]QKF62416.1 cytolethal distending toxin, subunit CdtC [Campylobacter mucosalis]
MKILVFILAFFITFINAAENITDTFQIRNAKTGFPINTKRESKIFNYQNWYLNDLGIDEKIKKIDKFADAFPFGYVQFKVVINPQMCLSVAPSGFLVLKDCKKDYDSSEFETIFQIIPTTTSAVQIRSLLLGTNECLGIFTNPQVFVLDRVGLVECLLDHDFTIEPARLFTLTPPVGGAMVIK